MTSRVNRANRVCVTLTALRAAPGRSCRSCTPTSAPSSRRDTSETSTSMVRWGATITVVTTTANGLASVPTDCTMAVPRNVVRRGNVEGGGDRWERDGRRERGRGISPPPSPPTYTHTFTHPRASTQRTQSNYAYSVAGEIHSTARARGRPDTWTAAGTPPNAEEKHNRVQRPGFPKVRRHTAPLSPCPPLGHRPAWPM